MRTEAIRVKLRDGEMGARYGGRTYSQPEADRALALTVDFFKQHLGAA